MDVAVPFDPNIIGIGSSIIAFVLIIMMPVSKHRVNQTLVSVLIALFIFAAAFSFFGPEQAVIVGIAITLIALAGRAIIRFTRTCLYHNVTRYTRRDFWQRRVGRAILGGGRRGRES